MERRVRHFQSASAPERPRNQDTRKHSHELSRGKGEARPLQRPSARGGGAGAAHQRTQLAPPSADKHGGGERFRIRRDRELQGERNNERTHSQKAILARCLTRRASRSWSRAVELFVFSRYEQQKGSGKQGHGGADRKSMGSEPNVQRGGASGLGRSPQLHDSWKWSAQMLGTQRRFSARYAGRNSWRRAR